MSSKNLPACGVPPAVMAKLTVPGPGISAATAGSPASVRGATVGDDGRIGEGVRAGVGAPLRVTPGVRSGAGVGSGVGVVVVGGVASAVVVAGGVGSGVAVVAGGGVGVVVAVRMGSGGGVDSGSAVSSGSAVGVAATVLGDGGAVRASTAEVDGAEALGLGVSAAARGGPDISGPLATVMIATVTRPSRASDGPARGLGRRWVAAAGVYVDSSWLGSCDSSFTVLPVCDPACPKNSHVARRVPGADQPQRHQQPYHARAMFGILTVAVRGGPT